MKDCAKVDRLLRERYIYGFFATVCLAVAILCQGLVSPSLGSEFSDVIFFSGVLLQMIFLWGFYQTEKELSVEWHKLGRAFVRRHRIDRVLALCFAGAATAIAALPWASAGVDSYLVTKIVSALLCVAFLLVLTYIWRTRIGLAAGSSDESR